MSNCFIFKSKKTNLDNPTIFIDKNYPRKKFIKQFFKSKNCKIVEATSKFNKQRMPIIFTKKSKLRKRIMKNGIRKTRILTRKNSLSKLISKLQNQKIIIKHPKTFEFIVTNSSIKFGHKNIKNVLTKHPFWIIKPSNSSRSRGILIINTKNLKTMSLPETKQYFLRILKNCKFYKKNDFLKNNSKITKFIVQRYIWNPFLYKNRKIDYRCYLLIASVHPLVVFYGRGHIRVASEEYSLTRKSLQNKYAHLTNGARGRSNPFYNKKTDTVRGVRTRMPFVEFAKYFKKNKNNERNLCFIEKQIVVALKRLVFNVFKENSEELKLKKYENYNFDLLGADFLITQDGEIFLLEVQYKPGLSFRKGSIGEGNKLLLREYFDILLKVRKNRILRKNGDDWVFPKYKKFLMIK